MITKSALIGLAHFLMQADPTTAQHVLDQLSVQESEQVVHIIEVEELRKSTLPESFRKKLTPGDIKNVSSPSHETSVEM